MSSRTRTAALTVLSLLAALVTVLPLTASPASATAGDVGYRGPSYTGASYAPTSDKPQSKLWYNDGSWWADMFSSASKTWHVFRLDRPTETWVDTGVLIDPRKNTLADVLWDGTHLYVASHVVTISSDTTPVAAVAGQQARLYRYSYTPAGGYTLDAGFPAQIASSSSESMTLDKDSTGTLWATWTQVSGSASTGFTNAVYVNATSGSDSTWGTPFVVPVAGSNPSPDDISAVVAYGRGSGSTAVGVLWSNQLDGSVYWATHKDGDPVSRWKGSVAVRGTKLPDDHLNVKTLQTDASGRVFAVVKTSLDDAGAPASSPLINLLVFKPGTGSWSSTTVGTVGDCHTRPIVVLDDEHAVVHVFATAPTQSGCPYTGYPGTIYEKTSPLDSPSFAPGRGTPVIRDAASEGMNDVTSTKQTVNSATGLVVLASNQATSRYWHADEALGVPAPPPPAAPVASFTATPTSGAAPLTTQLTDTSTGSPTSWAWDLGDGTTSTTQNPSHAYTAAGSYAVTLTATGPGGSSTSTATTITVTAPPPPPAAPVASFTATRTSGAAPLTTQLTDTSTGSPTSWAWDLGDGTTSTTQNPSHAYTAAGSYAVTLTATGPGGSSTSTATTITVTAPPPPATHQVVAAGSTTAASPATTAVTLTAPAGTAAGDLLVATFTADLVPTATAPAGWTSFVPRLTPGGSSGATLFGYYRVVPASDPATSWTWTLSSSVKWNGGMTRYTGVSATTPFDTAVSTGLTNNTAATSVTVPGVTTVTAGALVIGGYGADGAAVTATRPSGWTEAWQSSGQQVAESAWSAPSAPGPVPAATWSLNQGRAQAAWLVALRPS